MPSENLRARAARYKGGLEYFVLTTVGLIPSHVARKALYRLFGMKIDRSAWIYARCEVRSPHGITIGANSVIGIDGMIVCGICLLIVRAMDTGEGAFLPAAVVLALVSFISTSVVARYIEARDE